MKTLLRILVIGAILLILVFLSIGMVKIVPKALSSLASATVSIGSIFGNDENATTTPSTEGGLTQSNGGFVIVSSSTSSGQNSGAVNSNDNANKNATTSILDLIKPKFGSYPYNNYVPTVATTTSSVASSPTSSPSICATANLSDLAISIISRGVISKTTGQFVETNNFATNDTVVIKFKVENRGTCSTGTWSFKAEMPSQNTADQVRTIASVNPIPAGSAITGQANFDSPRAGTSNVVLTVTDTSGRDANTSNNVATSPLTVINNGTGNTNNVIVSGDGRADLIVRVLQTGVLTYNNQFIPTGTSYGNFRIGDRVAVKFEVVNQGQTASGIWNFRAEMSPVNQQYQNNQYEASIPSGGRITYTLAFDNPQIGSNSITIFADSMNQVNEFNEGNNIATASFNVSY